MCSHDLLSWLRMTQCVLMQTPKLRLHAHRLTDRTCLAVRLGLLSNLESLRISRLRDENDVQASSFPPASLHACLQTLVTPESRMFIRYRQ